MNKKGISIILLLSAALVLAGCRGGAGVKPGSLTIRIYEATTAANAPQPIQSNATVSVYAGTVSGMEAILHRQLLKPNGHDGESYVFDNLPPNVYSVAVDAPGYSHPEDPQVPSQTSAPGRAPQRAVHENITRREGIPIENGSDYEIVVYMQKTSKLSYGSIKGKVTGLRADGVNVGGIPDVVVAVGGRSAKTNSSGDYRIDNIMVTGEPMPLGVFPPQDGTPLWEPSGDHSVMIAEGGVETIYNIQLMEHVIDEEKAFGDITGVVNAIGEDGGPLFGYDYSQVFVYIYRAGTNIDPIRVGKCDSDGSFEIDNIPTTRFGETFKVVVTACNAMNTAFYTFQDPLLPEKVLTVPEGRLQLTIYQGAYRIRTMNSSGYTISNVSGTAIFEPTVSSGDVAYSLAIANPGALIPGEYFDTDSGSAKLPYGSYSTKGVVAGTVAGPATVVPDAIGTPLVVDSPSAPDNLAMLMVTAQETE